MKNFVGIGDKVQFTAAATVASGAVVVIGALIGVASGPVAAGVLGIANLTGVYRLPKAPSQAWTVGAKVYWDVTNARATTVATDNLALGAAIEAVAGGAGDTLGVVRLNGVAV